jgi:virginiamycin B lyase
MRGSVRRRRRTRLATEWLETRELLAVDLGFIAEYSIPTPASAPTDVALGPEGALWVTESEGDKIARYDPNQGNFTEYAVPTANGHPYSISPGDPTDPSLYFTENGGGKLGRITTAGQISEAPVTDAKGNPIANSPLVDLAYDPLGSAFYTSQSNAQQVGLFQVGDFFQYIPFQPGQFRPTASAPDSTNWGVAFDRSLQSTAVYFTERDADKIAVFETSLSNGFVTHEYPLAAGSKPLFIVQGPDGGFWFTESGRNRIGRIDPTTRAITEYALPTPDSQPWGITASATTIYFTESAGNKIGRISFANGKPTITEFALPNGGTPRGITVGDHGQVWFAEADGNRLGLYYGDATVTPPYVFSAAAALPVGFTPLGLTGTPDGNLYVYAWGPSNNNDGIGRIPTASPQDAAFFPYLPDQIIGLGAYCGWIATDGDGTIWSGSENYTTGAPVTYQIDPSGFPNYKIVRTYTFSSPTLTLGPDFVTMFGTDQNQLMGTGKIDRYDAAGQSQFSSLPPNATPISVTTPIAVGARGELWAAGLDQTSDQSAIFRFVSDFSRATIFPAPGTGLGNPPSPNYLAFASDGNIWFTDDLNNRVGRITEDGRMSFVSIPVAPGHTMLPFSLVSAPDGNLYFLEVTLNNLVRINPSTGAVTTTPLPVSIKDLLPFGETPAGFPANALAVGPDGNLWFSDPDASNPAVIRFSLPHNPGTSAPPPPATIGSYLGAAYRPLTGVPLSNDRLQAITRQAFGPRSKITTETALESLPAPRLKLLLHRLGRTILGTPEYRRAQLDRISATSLYHPADRKLLRARGPIEALRVSLLGSRSYEAARAGGRNDALVSAYYHDLLRRAPAPREARFWTHVLDRGASPRRVAAAIANRPEALAATVQNQYRRLLGRSATPNELAAQVKTLRRTKSTNGLILSLLTSPDFLGLLSR